MSKYLQANNQDGLKQVEYGEFPIEKCIPATSFYHLMGILEDYQTIYAAFGSSDMELYEEILEHYEVN
jgi:hypothetical protein